MQVAGFFVCVVCMFVSKYREQSNDLSQSPSQNACKLMITNARITKEEITKQKNNHKFREFSTTKCRANRNNIIIYALLSS